MYFICSRRDGRIVRRNRGRGAYRRKPSGIVREEPVIDLALFFKQLRQTTIAATALPRTSRSTFA
jgi:hypothetical protein